MCVYLYVSLSFYLYLSIYTYIVFQYWTGHIFLCTSQLAAFALPHVLMFMVASCAQNTAFLATVSALSRPSLITALLVILLCCFSTLRNISGKAPSHSELSTKTVHVLSLTINYCLCLWSSY